MQIWDLWALPFCPDRRAAGDDGNAGRAAIERKRPDRTRQGSGIDDLHVHQPETLEQITFSRLTLHLGKFVRVDDGGMNQLTPGAAAGAIGEIVGIRVPLRQELSQLRTPVR